MSSCLCCIISDEYKSIPVVHALLTDKSSQTYTRMWNMIVTHCRGLHLNLRPKRILLDYEAAMLKTVREVFPFCRLSGCNFHLAQSVYRKACEVGLKKEYAKKATIMYEVKKIIALSFLKPTYIRDQFKLLQANGPAKMSGLYKWFSKNYVFGSTKTSTPRFDPQLWSTYFLNKKKLPRTDNYAESFHQKVNKLIGEKHVGVGRLIKFLKGNCVATEQHLAKFQAGHDWPVRVKSKFIKRQKKINNVLQRNHGNPSELVKNLAYSMHIVP